MSVISPILSADPPKHLPLTPDERLSFKLYLTQPADREQLAWSCY